MNNHLKPYFHKHSLQYYSRRYTRVNICLTLVHTDHVSVHIYGGEVTLSVDQRTHIEVYQWLSAYDPDRTDFDTDYRRCVCGDYYMG